VESSQQYQTTHKPLITTYLPFAEEIIVGFTVNAIVVSTPVSEVEMGAVVTCGMTTHCDTDCNAADVDSAMCNLRVFSMVDFSVPLGGPTFIVATDDFTDVVALNDATLTAEVL